MTQTKAGTDNYIIGIDVAKDKLDIMILPSNKHFVVLNNRNQINQFIRKTLSHMKVEKIVMESTGGYERLAFELFVNAKLSVHIAHPNKVFYYGKSKGLFAKTDKLDAKILANYALDNELEESKFSKDQYFIKALSTRIIQIKEDLVTVRCRITSPSLIPEFKKSLARQEKWLAQELQLIESKLEDSITKDSKLKEIQDIIISVKGIGKVTANLLISQMEELGHLNKYEIAALSGLAPRNNDSGKKSGARMIRGGKEHVRKSLYLCALSAARYNNKFKLVYEKLIAAGKKPKVALIAIARKLIVLVNHLVYKNTKWDVEYEKNTIIV